MKEMARSAECENNLSQRNCAQNPWEIAKKVSRA